MLKLLCQNPHQEYNYQYYIINYSYAQHLDVVIDDIFTRNLFESSDFEVKFEIMLKNAFSKFFRYNRDFEI